MSGLLIAGVLIEVPKVTIIGPHDKPWVHLSPGDYRQRRGRPTMGMLHTTKGEWPQTIRPGKGPPNRAERTAVMWQVDPAYSGAAIVVGSDGVAACLCDLIAIETYNATVSNPFCIGIEIYQEPGGVIYQAAIDATVRICDAISDSIGIPRQYPGRRYPGHPITRLEMGGGRDAYGWFGHRDNTTRRGRGDPGDAIFVALDAAGYEPLDFDAREDLVVGRRRQSKLNEMGERLIVDGLFGQVSIAAMHRRGFESGRELDAAKIC